MQVPLVAIPISILGAIATILLMGFSLNLLTVLAMAAAVIGALLLLPRLIILFKAMGPEA